MVQDSALRMALPDACLSWLASMVDIELGDGMVGRMLATGGGIRVAVCCCGIVVSSPEGAEAGEACGEGRRQCMHVAVDMSKTKGDDIDK